LQALICVFCNLPDVPRIEWGTSKTDFGRSNANVVLEYVAVLPKPRLLGLCALLLPPAPLVVLRA